MLGILPVSILILVLSQTTELTEEVLTVFWIVGVLLSLVIGFFLSLRENCEMVGKRKGILITAFIAIYLIGCIVAVICLGAMLLRLIIQVILVVAGAILILLLVAIPTPVAEVAEEQQECSIEMIMVIVLTAVRKLLNRTKELLSDVLRA